MALPARHIALIPDGNRRWARQRGMGPGEGHRAGIARVGDVMAAAFDEGVEVFSFWWGSPANLLKRGSDEAAQIVAALDHWLRVEAPGLLQRFDAHLDVLGRWQELCPTLQGAVDVATAAAGRGPRRIVVLMAYDGREEIQHAIGAAARRGDPLQFADELWTAALPPVDLIIRSGDAPHLSAGFMLWQIAEASLHFDPTLWPDYGPERCRAALRDYRERTRRHGS